MYSPSSLVVVLRSMPVSLFLSRTLAPATVAPLGSVMTPLTLPVVTCPRAGSAVVSRNSRASTADERDFAQPLKPAGDFSQKVNLIVGSFRKLVLRAAATAGRAA